MLEQVRLQQLIIWMFIKLDMDPLQPTFKRFVHPKQLF